MSPTIAAPRLIYLIENLRSMVFKAIFQDHWIRGQVTLHPSEDDR